MKRITIQNEFTQWAEYLARYFGHDLLIYDKEGKRMWGEPSPLHREIEELQKNFYVRTVYQDIRKPIAYLDWSNLTPSEESILATIVPFIESQLDDEGAE
jgi:hypothetical protein